MANVSVFPNRHLPCFTWTDGVSDVHVHESASGEIVIDYWQNDEYVDDAERLRLLEAMVKEQFMDSIRGAA